ncbi:MAG TPA: tetratricopeptide repeat protein, partial [Thermoanaerobaculia bacterium]|nr:tetratricopeptide repeat protein [Thermoanaerobaculia bacterium]
MRLALALILLAAAGVSADELRRADELAWSGRFEEAEALYRSLLPARAEARLGLARVVMWQGRYREAIALFEAIEPPTIDALEGRATAAYWSGDYRAAARGFRRVLALDPTRELAAKSLREIESTARPSQSVTMNGVRDDQPLDGIRIETAATFFSDPLTKWTARAGSYRVEDHRGELAIVENETAFPQLRIGASLGLFEFPDGVVRPIGGAHVRVRSVTLSIARREELATLAALRTHIATTTTALRWDHDRTWLAAVEASHRAYSDGNDGWGVSAWAVFPLL